MYRCLDCKKYPVCKYADPAMPGCLGFRDPEFDPCSCGSDAVRVGGGKFTPGHGKLLYATCTECGRTISSFDRSKLVTSWNNGEGGEDVKE